MNEIVIIGAGYAGMTAAMSLAGRTRGRDDVRLTLVNPQAHFTERLRLHQLASGQQLAQLDIPELLSGTAIRFVQGWVTGIDAAANTVRIDDQHVLRYDTLVYALGAMTDRSVPGIDEHAFTLDSDTEAGLLADRLKQLDHGTVVIVGGGLTAVECAGEIAEQHPDLDVELLSAQQPAPMMGQPARQRLLAGLTRLGVRVRSDAEVVKVMPNGIGLADGSVVDAAAVLWTAGVQVSPLAAAAGLSVDDRGRIVTDESLRSVSHPRVYAIGDAAAVTQRYGVIHGTCGVGIAMAGYAADAIVREMDGKPLRRFRFGFIHQPVSVGRHDAVVQFTHPDDSPSRLHLAGRWAARYKETFSSSPWRLFRLLHNNPRLGMTAWRRGGQYTR